MKHLVNSGQSHKTPFSNIVCTVLFERPRQTAQCPTCHRLARHCRGANLQRHAVAQTTHIRPLRTTTTIRTPATL